MSKPPKKLKPRRRWWQRALRAAVLVALIVAVVYITFPWWAPVGLIRDIVAGDLARQLGVDVSIKSLSLSWADGIRISELTIGSPRQFGPDPMVRIEAIRAEYAPVTLFVRNRIRWVEVQGPQLAAQFDAGGNCNLSPLGRLRPIELDRVSIHGAAATVKLPKRDRPLKLDIADVQIRGGRLSSLGSVTMSAALEQEEAGRSASGPFATASSTTVAATAASGPGTRDAPISLQMAGGAEDEPAASASLSFGNIDLGQLDLPQLAGLPLKELAGRCGGSLDLRINRKAEVDGLTLDVSVRRLNLQPLGDTQFPLIDEARLRLNASFDLAVAGGEGKIVVHSFRIGLPPEDEVSGQATVLASIRDGNWQAIKSVDLGGMIHPSRMALLWRGRPARPDEVDAEGPVEVKFSSRNLDGRLAIENLWADFKDSTIRYGGRGIKPAGRPMQVSLAGVFDKGFRAFSAGPARLKFGANELVVTSGTILNCSRLAGLLHEKSPSIRRIMQGAGLVDLGGSLEVRDLDSLRDLSDDLAKAMKDAALTGRVSGQWSVKNSPASVQLALRADKATTLKAAGRFAKPAGVVATLQTAGNIDADKTLLKDIDFDVTVGDGWLDVDRATLAFEEPKADGKSAVAVSSAGDFDCLHVESLLACLPELPGGLSLRGTLHGQYDVSLGSPKSRVTIKTDLSRLEFTCGRALALSGEKGWLEFGLEDDKSAPPAQRVRYSADAMLGQARLTAIGTCSELADGVPDAASFDLVAEVKDAAWLKKVSPTLSERLGPQQAMGPCTLASGVGWADGALDATVKFTGDDMEYVWSGAPVRAKTAGTPLGATMDLHVRRTGTAGTPMLADIRKTTVRVGETQLALTGQARLESLDPPPGGGRTVAVTGFEGSLSGEIHADAALRQLLPEAAGAINKHGLSGQLALAGTIVANRDGIKVSARLDADKLVARHVGPLVVGKDPDTGSDIEIGPLVKPAGLPAGMEMELALAGSGGKALFNSGLAHITGPGREGFTIEPGSDGLSEGGILKLAAFKARVGDLAIGADGSAGVKMAGTRPVIEPQGGRVSISTADARFLCQLWPELAGYEPAGDASIDLHWSGAEGRELDSAEFVSKGLTGRYNFRDLRVAGRLSASGIRLDSRGQPHVGRLQADKLEFSIGGNQGWLIADIQDVLHKPTGTFDVLFSRMSDIDLLYWSQGRTPEEVAAALAVKGIPTQKITAEARAKALAEARKVIALARRRLAQADIQGHVGIKHMLTFDGTVNELYDALSVDLNVTVKDGRLGAQYVACLNGGDFRQRLEVDLTKPDPALSLETDLKDVCATESIQPQLVKLFPGNTVIGTFNQKRVEMMALEDALAHKSNPLYRLRPAGWARTLLVDGVLTGRAAPKAVTAIFPGLNLARTRYKKMTIFADERTDGTTYNDIIVDGADYDMYIEGVTGPDDIGRYDIGLILLNKPQSPEWNHEYHLGRLLLLTFKARIEGGRLYDEAVSYPWPHEALAAMFIKNNRVYQLWSPKGK
ncbi:MAG: AsmA family protein [Phycisphaerae bacterium]